MLKYHPEYHLVSPKGEKMALNLADYDKVSDSLYRHKKDNSKFLFYFKIDNKLYRKTYKSSGDIKDNRTQLKDAKAALLNYQNEIKSGDKIDESVTLDKLFEMKVKLDKPTDWNKKKQWYYGAYIQKDLGGKKVSTIKKLHIQSILAKMEKEGLKPRTQKAVIEVLKPLFRMAIENKICKEDPTEFIKIKVIDQKKPVINASEKFVKLYTAVMEVYKDDPFMRALFLFALIGRRKGEILTLKWQNIDFENNIYWLLSDDTKPDKNQKFSLSQDLRDALLEIRQPSGLVFTSPITGGKMVNLARQVDKIREASGVKEWSLHYSRNIIVSALCERGVDAVYLSGILGHTDINTINKYLSQNTLKASEVGLQNIAGLLG